MANMKVDVEVAIATKKVLDVHKDIIADAQKTVANMEEQMEQDPLSNRPSCTSGEASGRHRRAAEKTQITRRRSSPLDQLGSSPDSSPRG